MAMESKAEDDAGVGDVHPSDTCYFRGPRAHCPGCPLRIKSHALPDSIGNLQSPAQQIDRVLAKSRQSAWQAVRVTSQRRTPEGLSAVEIGSR